MTKKDTHGGGQLSGSAGGLGGSGVGHGQEHVPLAKINTGNIQNCISIIDWDQKNQFMFYRNSILKSV